MRKYFFIISVFVFQFFTASSQHFNLLRQDTTRRPIGTAVPLFSVSPDARASGMGDVGVATTPDNNASYWNVAKLSFTEDKLGFGISYNNWQDDPTQDIDLYYYSGFYKIDPKQTVGLTYFKTNVYHNSSLLLQAINFSEFMISGSYSRRLMDNMGLGISLKYIKSNVPENIYSSTGSVKPGQSLALDLGWYWVKRIGDKYNLAVGTSINNIGGKITYSSDEQKQFLPGIFRFGFANKYKISGHHSISFALDLSKLMAPTTPIYQVDENGSIVRDHDGNPVIRLGKDQNRSLLHGVFGSFADAPLGLEEELWEIMIGLGIEYWYKDFIAFRGGYFSEHYYKGNRKYFTTGLGVKYEFIGADFAYLIPAYKESYIQDVWRISISLNLPERLNK